MRKSIRKTGRHICCFYIDNKMLFLLSVCAIGFMLFYYFSYDETELWRNACVLVEILFQLSLAIVANLIFFIFHVYLPSCKRTYRMRPIIIKKINSICEKINDPFQDITKRYLGEKKNLDELFDSDIQLIAEMYRPNDESTVQVAYLCKNLTYNQYFQICFKEIEDTIQDLLYTYDPYLNSEERDILLLLKESHCWKLLNDPLMSLFDITGIKGNAALDMFKQYKYIYERILELSKQ